MGYESRLIIVDRVKTEFCGQDFIFVDKIAEFDLSCVSWRDKDNLFKTLVDFDFPVAGEEKMVRIDKYGKICRMAKPKEVIAELTKMAEKDYYRRYLPILSLLTALYDYNHDWNDLRVIHYGY